ncbi:hypothetical protein [Aquimarina longa]|uniref:hypothetical protein n=1 Tax=Aquimarina longa TaxID=1080221 RepID=UPI00130E9CF1|nr:hypothetical protein [Aquimarina longa]
MIFQSNKDYDYQIGILVCEMEYIRNETINLTNTLSIKELDYHFDKNANSIGSLLMHISALEFKFLLNFLLKRPFSLKEREKFGPAMPSLMHQRLIKGNNIEYYINELKLVREQTCIELKKLSDDWLSKEIISSDEKNLGNHLYLKKHILYDEISHQGQIKMMIKRL